MVLVWCAELALYIRWLGASGDLELKYLRRALRGLSCPSQGQEPLPGCSDCKLRLFFFTTSE